MRFCSLIFSSLLISMLASCSNAGEEKLQERILANARKYRDVNAASLALQTLVAIDSVKYSSYKDSLLMIYASGGAEPQAILLGKELLAKNPKDTTLLKVLANASNNLGMNADAAKYFSYLYDLTGKPGFLYEIAIISYKDKQLKDCEITLDRIEKLPDAVRKSVNIVFTYENGPRQSVPIDVAVANLHGVVEQEKGDKAKAEEYFTKAITLMPAFAQANANLRRLNEQKSK